MFNWLATKLSETTWVQKQFDRLANHFRNHDIRTAYFQGIFICMVMQQAFFCLLTYVSLAVLFDWLLADYMFLGLFCFLLLILTLREELKKIRNTIEKLEK